MNKTVIDSPIGKIAIFAENEKIIRINLKKPLEAMRSFLGKKEVQSQGANCQDCDCGGDCGSCESNGCGGCH